MAYRYKPQSLNEKAIVLSGGTTGIGRAAARRFVIDGAKVLIFGRHDAELQDALLDIRRSVGDSGGEIYSIVADAADPKDIDRVADRLLGIEHPGQQLRDVARDHRRQYPGLYGLKAPHYRPHAFQE